MSRLSPEDEEKRLAALYRYNLLDTPAEESFDCITGIATKALDVPISLITLIDKDRQWFKSRTGVPFLQTSRDVSFCSRTIEGSRSLIIPNLRKDPIFAENPYVRGTPFLRFYCGVPLRTSDGFNIGSLCVLGLKPRNLKQQELAVLTDLARLAIDQIELRHIADRDYLTGLPTHRVLIKTGIDDLKRSRETSTTLSIILFEIERFENIGRSYGYEVSAKLAQAVVDRCKPLVPKDALFARIGGGRYAICLHGMADADAKSFAQKIQNAISTMDGSSFGFPEPPSCRVGMAVSTSEDVDFRLLYFKADRDLNKNSPAPTAANNAKLIGEKPLKFSSP